MVVRVVVCLGLRRVVVVERLLRRVMMVWDWFLRLSREGWKKS